MHQLLSLIQGPVFFSTPSPLYRAQVTEDLDTTRRKFQAYTNYKLMPHTRILLVNKRGDMHGWFQNQTNICLCKSVNGSSFKLPRLRKLVNGFWNVVSDQINTYLKYQRYVITINISINRMLEYLVCWHLPQLRLSDKILLQIAESRTSQNMMLTQRHAKRKLINIVQRKRTKESKSNCILSDHHSLTFVLCDS